MKKVVTLIATLTFVTTVALAQSSGNFSYGDTGGLHCILNKGNGAITGGATCSSGTDCSALGCSPIPATGGTCSVDSDCASNFCVNPTGAAGAGQCAVGTCGGSINAGIKTNSGSGNVFLIRPSAVIGLLTDVSVQKNSSINIGTSSAFAGVDFSINVTPPAGAPQPCVSPNYSITYAARFIQISTNLFDVLGTLCTTVGTNPVGGVTTATGCFITFDESTVSAHSFDWVAGDPGAAGSNGNPSNCGTLQSGVYGIAANWKASLGNSGISESLTCVGPVNLTVQQNKIFHFNTVN